MTDTDVIDPESAYKENLLQYEEKYKEFLTEDAIKFYSARLGITRDEAKLKLIANFENEKDSVDAKAIALKAMKGVRMIGPKVGGLEAREQDVLIKVKNMERAVSGFQQQIDLLKKELKTQKDVFKQAIAIMNKQEIEKKPKSKGFFAWMSNKFKIFLLKKRNN